MKTLKTALLLAVLAPAPAMALELTCQFGFGFGAAYRAYSLQDDGTNAAVKIDGRWIPAARAPETDPGPMIAVVAITGPGTVETMAARPGKAYLTRHSLSETASFSNTLTGRCN